MSAEPARVIVGRESSYACLLHRSLMKNAISDYFRTATSWRWIPRLTHRSTSHPVEIPPVRDPEVCRETCAGDRIEILASRHSKSTMV